MAGDSDQGGERMKSRHLIVVEPGRIELQELDYGRRPAAAPGAGGGRVLHRQRRHRGGRLHRPGAGDAVRRRGHVSPRHRLRPRGPGPGGGIGRGDVPRRRPRALLFPARVDGQGGRRTHGAARAEGRSGQSSGVRSHGRGEHFGAALLQRAAGRHGASDRHGAGRQLRRPALPHGRRRRDGGRSVRLPSAQGACVRDRALR